MAKIVLVEDERVLAETIAFNLTEEGYQMVLVENGLDALNTIRREEPDLILLDIMLPGIDGLEICRVLRRQRADIPVIMLTAKSHEIDKVIGLEVGADDYITKPFGMMELVARIRAALRRTSQPATPGDVLRAQGIELDVARHTVLLHNREIELRPKEFELLRILLANRGKVVERDTLFDRIWGEDDIYDQGTLDVHIRRLREKIEDEPGNPKRVLTVRGIGYKYAG